MKKYFLILCFLCIVFNSAKAELPVGAYVGFGTGISSRLKTKDFDSRIYGATFNNKIFYRFGSNSWFTVDISAGIRIFNIVRIEIEQIYRHNYQKLKTTENTTKRISDRTVMANIYLNVYNWNFEDKTTSIFLRGGYGRTTYDSDYLENHRNRSYNLGFGGTFGNEFVKMDIGYRYIDMGSPRFAGLKRSIYANDIYFAMRLGF